LKIELISVGNSNFWKSFDISPHFQFPPPYFLACQNRNNRNDVWWTVIEKVQENWVKPLNILVAKGEDISHQTNHSKKNPNSAKKQKRSLSVIASRKYLQNPPYKLNYVQCKHFEARSENGNEKLKCT
jgi:hypothetical protein